jgi:hypothetical protein
MHYVNNEQFVKELVEYKARLELNPSERVPEYVGHCILEICKRFASRPNFYGYSYRDEMVSDAVENCLMYLTNFDPAKSNNAFSYYTQIAFYAFIRRITREKKQSYIKHKLIQEVAFESYDTNGLDDSELSQSFLSFIQSHSSFEHSSFDKPPKKVKVRELTALEKFMEESE